MIITPQNSLAVVVDIQEKLLPHIHQKDEILKNTNILVEGLKIFDIPFILNEQYPQGLGNTIEELRSKLENVQSLEKTCFSCCANEQTREKIIKSKKTTAIVFGIETHICVLQTCLDLIANNISPVLVVDCCGSRKKQDKDLAVQRMVQAGVIPTSYEALLFELCKSSKHPNFKEISKLVK
ncbi:MAG: hydrolase [Proteobacteria bacterium]|nr:MAG: hydrolase [Pseudomonadota bacterium]